MNYIDFDECRDDIIDAIGDIPGLTITAYAYDEIEEEHINDYTKLVTDESYKPGIGLMCDDCKIELIYHNDTQFKCKICSFVKDILNHEEVFSNSGAQNYNSITNGPHTTKYKGKKAKLYNMLSTNKNPRLYDIKQKYNLRIEISGIATEKCGNSLHERNGACWVTEKIVNETIDIYATLYRKGKTKRSGPRKSLIKTCLYYTSIRHDLYKPIANFCKQLNIKPHEFTDGKREYDSLCLQKILPYPPIFVNDYNKKPKYIESLKTKFEKKGRTIKQLSLKIKQYMHFYFNLLNIPVEYVDLCCSIVKKSYEIKCNHNDATRCVGVIYYIKNMFDISITKDMIINKCLISHSTFNAFYNFIKKNPVLNQVCSKKH